MPEESTSHRRVRWEIEKKINIGVVIALIVQTITASGTIIWIARGVEDQVTAHTEDIKVLKLDNENLHQSQMKSEQVISRMETILQQLLESNKEMRTDIKDALLRSYRNDIVRTK